MNTRNSSALIALYAAMSAAMVMASPTSAPHRVPWWDDFPTFVQTPDVSLAERVHATANLCGAADDPCWGLFGQRLRIEADKTIAQKHHARTIHPLTWFEGFGTTEAYIAQLKRDANGAWDKEPGAPSVTRVYRTHWGWQQYDGTGEIRWIGLHDYYNDLDYARPFTRTTPRYAAPPARYPNGRSATGVDGPADDPRAYRVYDAMCAKDVNGNVTYEYEFNTEVNRVPPGASTPHGPLTGLLKVANPTIGVPDPGYTPEQWRSLKSKSYAGLVSMGKDSACPLWIDYARASVRQALDTGIDGLWVDNYSPWDSFGGQPNQKAFGEWSVAGFRPYVRAHFNAAALKALGITTPNDFDIRAYLISRCKAWGGDPTNLNDPKWRDPRWQDDALWRAYLIYKRQTGTRALSAYYRAIKQEAARAGKPDFLVSGNDIPGYSLGWVRGDLDMVSTELTWGWWLTTGPRGLMPPPYGCYVPVYKLAREHAKSRFVNLWMYVPEEQKAKPGIANVLYYQGLASHALPMPLYPHGTVGNEATDGAFHSFVRSAGSEFGRRAPIEEVGIYYSSSSQLMEMLPGGFRDHANQPHSFAFYGWGTALTMAHYQWRAVPEWKLNASTLALLKMLIIPSADVFPARDVPTLERWVRAGGTLIIAGECGVRQGEQGNFDRAPSGSTLAALLRPDGVLTRCGRGSLLRYRTDPAIPFYLADKQRTEMLSSITAGLRRAWPSSCQPTVQTDAPWDMGITVYSTPRQLFVDLNNTRIDLATDTIAPQGPVRISVRLPEALRGHPLRVRVLAPRTSPSAKIDGVSGGIVHLTLNRLSVYASLIIEPL